MSEKPEENSKISTASLNILHISNPGIQLESLMEISSSSVNSNASDNSLHRQVEVEHIVMRVLKDFKSNGCLKDIDENHLASLIVPKVLMELKVHNQLYEEMQGIKQTLNSYIQHTKVVGEDIAEIFLDLHNIYSKLEKVDKVDTKFIQRVQEAEDYLESKKHYISNDVTLLSNSSTDSCVSSAIQKDANVISSDVRRSEKQAFLTNMVMVKKSDFSLELNRDKQFYTEVKKALNTQFSPQ